MSSVSAPNDAVEAELRAGREPSYEVGKRDAELIARFASGERVPVVKSRARAYPNLPSSAPSTLAFYEAFIELVSGKHVVDAGTGAGAGARILCRHFAQVSGLDNDARALEFARKYAPHAHFLQADLCHGSPLDQADAALMVDVLGHVVRPTAALRTLRACLLPGGKLLVAEPKAHASQRLTTPARRAFSKAALGQLLLRSGFEVEELVCGGATFIALVARRSEDPLVDALVEAFQHAERGQLDAARAEFARAERSPRPEVLLEVRLGQAEIAFASNDGDGAARHFFEANELGLQDGRGLGGLARIALATNQLEDARSLATDALRFDPTDAEATTTLALAVEQLTQAEALHAWRLAGNLAPDDAEVATGLARVSAQQQNYAFAIQVFERLRSYETPLSLEFHVTLGWLLLADGRRNDAKVEVRYASALSPDHPAVLELSEAASAPSD